MLVDYATKISTNVNFRHHLVEMGQHVKILTVHTNVFVPKDMKDVIVQSTLMTVLLSPAKTEEPAWMELVTTLVCVTMVLKENIAKSISMNVFHNHVKTVQLATNT